MLINLNHEVKVKLTDKGKEILKKYAQRHNQFMPDSPFYQKKYGIYTRKLRGDIFTEQLHEIFRIFGGHNIGTGFDVPFDTAIYMNDEDLEQGEL